MREEELLNAYINQTLSLKSGRYLANMTFIEAILCRQIYDKMGKGFIRQTDISKSTMILKSSVNRTISVLVKKGIVERFKKDTDKKSIYLRIKDDKVDFFLDEHKLIMEEVTAIAARLSEEEIDQTIKVYNNVARVCREMIQEKKDEN